MGRTAKEVWAARWRSLLFHITLGWYGKHRWQLDEQQNIVYFWLSPDGYWCSDCIKKPEGDPEKEARP